MAFARRESPHHYFLAECGRCGFAVEGEIVNGYGGWKTYDLNHFSSSCSHRTAAGRPTMVCPHLHAAKLAAQPLSADDFHCRMRSRDDRDTPSVEGSRIAIAP